MKATKENKPTENKKQNRFKRFLMNATRAIWRESYLNKIFDPRRDIDDECGYPKTPELNITQYRELYDREGVAKRIVVVYPEESWADDPEVIETTDSKETPFEIEWKKLQKEKNIFHYLNRIDEMSGIGRYGVLLLGIDDGKNLSEPADGINERGEPTGKTKHKLLYLRPFDESVLSIVSIENDKKNPRYGLPTMYQVKFEDANGVTASITTQNVHWSRIIHVADNRTVSEVFGTPRIQVSYNRVYDLRKLLGGSAEMFWKGAFPGLTFEVNPDLSDATLDTESLQETFEDYMNGLQRYIAVQGGKVNSLSPQVADPKNHIEIQLKIIAITMSVPTRILFGSEEAKLASTQDSKTWNKRLKRRQEKYLSPMLIRPFIDRLIAFGILPQPKEYNVVWPDLNVPSDLDKAEVAVKWTDALAKYVTGGVDALIPPAEYMTIVLEMDPEEVKTILEAMNKYIVETDDEIKSKEPTSEEDQPEEDVA